MWPIFAKRNPTQKQPTAFLAAADPKTLAAVTPTALATAAKPSTKAAKVSAQSPKSAESGSNEDDKHLQAHRNALRENFKDVSVSPVE